MQNYMHNIHIHTYKKQESLVLNFTYQTLQISDFSASLNTRRKRNKQKKWFFCCQNKTWMWIKSKVKKKKIQREKKIRLKCEHTLIKCTTSILTENNLQIQTKRSRKKIHIVQFVCELIYAKIIIVTLLSSFILLPSAPSFLHKSDPVFLTFTYILHSAFFFLFAYAIHMHELAVRWHAYKYSSQSIPLA